MSKRAATNSTEADSFEVRSDGLHVRDAQGHDSLIAPSIRVQAIAAYEGSDTWYAVLSFVDLDGKSQRLVLPRGELVRPQLLLQRLANRGFALPSESKHRQLLVRYLANEIPQQRAQLSRTVGWQDAEMVYLLPDTVIGQSKRQILFEPHDWQMVGDFSRSGSLACWQQHVARRCATSSRLVLAVCASFAATILKFAGPGHESGGFHFTGPSSGGKTLLLLVARSVAGTAKRGQLRTWNATIAGLIDTAVGHCDNVLCLDELALALNDPKIGIKGVSQAAFTLASGVGRTVSSTSLHSRKSEVCKFRLFFLSTGEQSLYQLAGAHNLERLRGEQVRLIEIPVEQGDGRGIFDKLPADDSDSATLVDDIERACAENHGHALRAYVNYVCTLPAVSKRLTELADDFYESAFESVTAKSGWERRFASRFALAYAAGCLAIEGNIVPWDPELLRVSILRCYRDARATGPDQERLMAQAIRKVAVHLQRSARVVRLGNRLLANLPSLVARADAFVSPPPDRSEYYLRPEALRRWVEPAVSAKAVAEELDRRGLLKRDTTRRLPTRQVRLPGSTRRERLYVVSKQIISRAFE